MQLFIEQLLNGAAMGAIYALITLGLALVYGVLRILHVAHAGVYTAGAYSGLYVSRTPAVCFWPSSARWSSARSSAWLSNG